MANLDYNYENNQSDERQTSLSHVPSAQENFESAFAEELPIFAGIILEAHELMLTDLSDKSVNFQNRNSKANRMNENIRGILFDAFPENMVALRDRFVFVKDDYLLFFKKLGSNSKPNNIPTFSSDRMLQQSIFDQKIIVFIGYEPDGSWDEINRMSAVYICQNSVVWVTDLREFINGIHQTPIFPDNPDSDSPLVVRPKSIPKFDTSANEAASQ